ncbi:MAG: glycerophosphodiester phosphodiesterase [Caulobacteraceae bacterium]|nr:glycerophosphodiester phosphodiesterase [Caulobacteraceae bacterium]
MLRALIPLLIGLAFAGDAMTAPAAFPPAFTVIAHRGASGERPEHTRSAYLLAIEQGADFIEPDLVMSRDGALVVRHENEIGETTDVADHPEFAGRKATKVIDGQTLTGWFTEDFTLAELKTLRAKERLPQLRPGNTKYDGRDEILTFDEVATIAREATARTGRTIGVYPELKHPSYFESLGFDPESRLVEALTRLGWTGRTAPVFVQCFEVGPLERLHHRIETPLIQLMGEEGGPADHPDWSYAVMARAEGLRAIAAYADGVGVEKTMVLPRDAEGRSLAPTPLVADAHAAGLKVHIWTLRAENFFLPLERRSGLSLRPDFMRLHGDLAGEIRAFRQAGVDGVFSDFPGIAASTR